MGKQDAEQIEVPGTEREVDQQLENAIRQLKAKNEAATEARNEVKRCHQKGTDLLKEKGLESYTSEKQGFTLVKNDKEDVKLVPYSPPRPPKASKGAEA